MKLFSESNVIRCRQNRSPEQQEAHQQLLGMKTQTHACQITIPRSMKAPSVGVGAQFSFLNGNESRSRRTGSNWWVEDRGGRRAQA